MVCFKDAAFTKRIGTETEVSVIPMDLTQTMQSVSAKFPIPCPNTTHLVYYLNINSELEQLYMYTKTLVLKRVTTFSQL